MLKVIIKMKRHSLVQINAFFNKTRFSLLKPIIFNLKHQPNVGIFLSKTAEKFNLVKIFCNVTVRL